MRLLGQRQSPAALFLIASIQEDESWPSAAVEKQEETEAGTHVGSPDCASTNNPFTLLEGNQLIITLAIDLKGVGNFFPIKGHFNFYNILRHT